MASRERPAGQADSRTAFRFVLLIGVLSFFANFTYEGARSVLGPYLALLGASGTIVGVVTGFGELLGYSLRLVSGRLAALTGRFWTIATVGYTHRRLMGLVLGGVTRNFLANVPLPMLMHH